MADADPKRSGQISGCRFMFESTCTRDHSVFHWLALERIPQVGPLTIARLMDAFESPEAAMAASAPEIRKRAQISEPLARRIAENHPNRESISRDMETLEKLGARVMTRWDSDYPTNLRDIYDPPAILFVRGRIAREDTKAAAIVGTRNPTRYGREMAEAISRGLARSGVTIISGLARGIDTTCHRAALKEGGRTIGVLGCGLDVVYPRENKSLIEEIVQSGAVITEFRPRVPPAATNFYRRNRVVSGLSKGVVVVEAGMKSGSLITAEHALDQNREVFAVPGNVMNLRSRGPHKLLRDGAALVESAQDVIEAIFAPPATPIQPTVFEAADQDDLTDMGRTVLENIDPDPVPMDTLCESLSVDAGTLAAVLLDLELRGLIRQYPGKMFGRIVRPS